MVTSPKSDRCWLPSHAQGVLFLLTLRWPLCGCGRDTAPLASFFLLPPQPRVWGGRGTGPERLTGRGTGLVPGACT